MGNQYIGWQSDNEKQIIDDSSIISITFGVERDFQIIEKKSQK